MIILNERKSEENDNKNSFSLNFIFIGSIYLTINVTLFSLGLVGQKFLCKEKLSPEEQTFYFGFYSFPTERAKFLIWEFQVYFHKSYFFLLILKFNMQFEMDYKKV